MLVATNRNAFVQEIDETNMLLKLKQKKKQMIDHQSQIQKKIKQYFSDLTIQIYHKQTAVLDSFKNKLYEFFQTIDSYCAMGQAQRNQNKQKIIKILHFQLEVVESKKFKQILQTNLVQICCQEQMDINVTMLSEEDQKTNKKGFANSNLILRNAYNEQISILQQKIQKLMLKQQKLKQKLGQMDSKHKMKKLGNAYLPYQQKSVSSLLLQRLQSENKILIQQIAECSEKILSLTSENSTLTKQRQNSNINILQTEKKKVQSINIIEQSIQFTQYQQKIILLQSQIESLRSQIQNQRKFQQTKQQEFINMKQKNEQQIKFKIQQLTDYNQRLYNECESNIAKKIQLQQKLQQQMAKYDTKCKQVQSLKQVNSNYAKLVKIKQDKIIEIQIQSNKLSIKLQQSEDNYKKLYVESAHNLENKENIIKGKILQIQQIKKILKKQQNQKTQLKQKLVLKQQQIYNQSQKLKQTQNQLSKANKQKQSYAKKEVKKAKNQAKKTFDEKKNAIQSNFKLKYGQFMEKLEALKKQYIDNKQKIERKLKIQQNRMNLFKDKVSFQTKQMLQKCSKPNQKQKILEVIQAYIENQSSISLKNCQIKNLKDEIANLKKPASKKETTKIASTQSQVSLSIQQFEKKLFYEKLNLQQQIHQSQIKQQRQQYELLIQQKVTALQNSLAKCQFYEKNTKQLKQELKSASQSLNPEMAQLKRNNEQMIQKQNRMQSLIASLKNTLTKVQSQSTQLKQQIKVKKQLVNGFKKQIKQKDLQKQKLNQTINLMIQDAQKLKRTSKEANKKQAIFEQFKEKLINQTQLSQQIIQLKINLQQRQKLHKIELNKRDQVIKQLKQNQQIANKKIKNQSTLEEQILDLRQKVRKLKAEIDRKDSLIQHVKQKQQKINNETVVAAQTTENENKKLKKQLQAQKAKLQGLRLKLRKFQSNYQLIKITLIKLFQKISQRQISTAYNSLQKQYNTFKTDGKKTRFEFTVEKTPQNVDINRYREGLSILQISGDDLQIGNSKLASQCPYSPIQTKQMPTNSSLIDISKLTELLQAPEIDTFPILALFNLVLDQRVFTQV